MRRSLAFTMIKGDVCIFPFILYGTSERDRWNAFCVSENQSYYPLNSKRQTGYVVRCSLPDDARQLTGTVESLPSYSGVVYQAPPLFILS